MANQRDLFRAFKPKGSVSKHDFDLTQRHVQSVRPGLIIPVLSLPVVPHDYFDLDMRAIIRSQTMNTAAFVRGKWHFDATFIPYVQIWHPYYQFIGQRNDKHSSLQKGTAFAPVISLATLLRIIYAGLTVTCYKPVDQASAHQVMLYDIHGYSIPHGMLRLLDQLGIGNFDWMIHESGFPQSLDVFEAIVTQRFAEKYINIFAPASYQHAWYDLYRNRIYDEQANINTTAIYDNSYVDFFNFDDIDCRAFSSSNIASALDSVQLAGDDSDWEAYYTASADTLQRVLGLFTMRYHQWKKDRFTGMMPSAQFGEVSTYESSPYDVTTNIINTTSSSSGTPAIVGTTSSVVPNSLYRQGVNNSTDWKLSVRSVVDVMALRKAELMQNWKMNALRAGNMTDDFMEAHYGCKPYYVSDENVRFLNQWSMPFDVTPITATAATEVQENGFVGDLAGQGSSTETRGNTLKAKFQDFGVLQVYAYFVPEAEYGSDMIEKEHTRHEKFDWFTKELENIGLVDEQAAQLSFSIGVPSTSQYASDPLLAPIGYNPPNIDLKTAVDKVHAGFYDQSIPYTVSGSSTVNYLNKSGSLSAWVAPRPTKFWTVGIKNGVLRPNLASFYINPNIYDKCMGINMGDNINTDNFICNTLFKVTPVRNMSVLGIPQF